jgi:NADH dehydrogenase
LPQIAESKQRLRKRLLQACHKKTAHSSAGENPVVDVAIIGAGATAVELAAELRPMESTFKDFRILAKGPQASLRINLLEAGSRVLPALPRPVSDPTPAVLDIGFPPISKQSFLTVSGRMVSLAYPADKNNQLYAVRVTAQTELIRCEPYGE